ncbi:amidase [Mesorhizobium sp.]|uniref:amidase n=1 Tax=Mesorhizobium sp. TaxID=1871066 RepID=UPI0011F9DB24|nr:amidase [Mesorhizobium sp.]TIO65370.1 MAG: amidase [Mesorhizobium sp.]
MKSDPYGVDTQSASEIANLLRSRTIGAVELMKHCLARIDEANPTINAVVDIDREEALTAAAEVDSSADAESSLKGIPYAVKDCFDVRGLRSTHGSVAFHDQMPKEDSTHVSRLRKEGAIPFVKTNLPPFCFGDQTRNDVVGLTRNPYCISKTVTASSGGSAAALAARMTLIADASDISGSALCPAAACNVVGFRPSHGVIPWHPAYDPYSVTNSVGLMARTISDIALMLSITSGSHKSTPTTSRKIDCVSELRTPPPIAGLKIAWSYSPAGTRTHPMIAAVLDSCRKVFEGLGCLVEEACPDLADAHDAHRILIALETWSAVRGFKEANEKAYPPEFVNHVSRITKYSADDIVRAMMKRSKSWSLMADFFSRFDVMVWPVNPQPLYDADLPESEIEFDWRPLEISPQFGLPSVSVPAGFSSDSLPVGIQILGRPGADELVLRVARVFEAETEYWKQGPPTIVGGKGLSPSY